MYEEFGDECVNFFRGMFAFAMRNGNQKRLVLARVLKFAKATKKVL